MSFFLIDDYRVRCMRYLVYNAFHVRKARYLVFPIIKIEKSGIWTRIIYSEEFRR